MPPTLSNRALYKTRKAARTHLETLGWTLAGKSMGDMVFRHPEKSFMNLIAAFKSGWEIQAWPMLVLDKAK